MARQHERTAARRTAAQILYSGAIRGIEPTVLLESGDITCLDDPLTDYGYELIEGVEKHAEEIDGRLESIAENWSVSRMPVMDLTILRLALFEMLYEESVPISVSINEAVELAKMFGGEDESPKFVNGMLGNIARQLEKNAESADGSGKDDETSEEML